MKTKSGAKKRFRKTASGKIKRAHAGKNHILTKKARKRKVAETKRCFNKTNADRNKSKTAATAV